ncbi:gamma-glutamylcyclotransferase family protein [Halomicronema hongdechloris]|nr:gamma-glutamylcyclotransferase family protein [Halomicronema hongdechloris]
MLQPSVYVFVYGTLKPGELAYDKICRPQVLTVDAAAVPGRLYHLPQGYPAITTEPGWVQGYRLGFPDATILTVLDEFEDCYPNRPEDSLYHRVAETVLTPDRHPLGTAWLYRMAPERVRQLQGRWLPQGCWSASRLS